MVASGLITARWLALLVPATLMAGALGSQYFGGLFPCEMCHWQRWPHSAAIVFALLSFLIYRTDVRRALILCAAAGIFISGAIGIFHAGVEYGWWQGITACTSTIRSTGSAKDMLAQIMRAPVVRCDTPQWSLFGISMAGYNALISIPAAIVIARLATRRPA